MAAEQKSPTKLLSTYRLLGTSGLRVSPICLGTMNFGLAKGWEWAGKVSKEEAFAIMDEYVKQGGNFLDTADVYHYGNSEQWVGEWMKERKNRSQVVIATKYTGGMGTDINSAGNHRKHMMEALDASLKRLQTDYIDILYVHCWDFTVKAEDLIRDLQEPIRQGKVLHIGVSDTPAWLVAQCNTIAQLRGWHPFVCYQGKYSLIDRDMERDIIPMCHTLNLGIVPWGAIGQGVLTGKYKRGQAPEDAFRLESPFNQNLKNIPDRHFDVAERVVQLAKEMNITPSQVALAWCLRDPSSSVLIGLRTMKHLQDNLGSTNVKFTDAQLKVLEDISKIDLGFPHNFLGGSSYKTHTWLARYGKIE